MMMMMMMIHTTIVTMMMKLMIIIHGNSFDHCFQEAHSHCIRMLSMKLSAYLLSSGHHHPYHYLDHPHHHHHHHDSVIDILQCSTGKKHSIDTTGTSHVLVPMCHALSSPHCYGHDDNNRRRLRSRVLQIHGLVSIVE